MPLDPPASGPAIGALLRTRLIVALASVRKFIRQSLTL